VAKLSEVYLPMDMYREWYILVGLYKYTGARDMVWYGSWLGKRQVVCKDSLQLGGAWARVLLDQELLST